MLVAIILMVAIAACCIRYKWHRTAITLASAALLCSLAIGCGPVAAWLLNDLQAPYVVKPTIAWGKKNAIILLGAGTEKIPDSTLVEPGKFSYGRIIETAGLYQTCRQKSADCKIIVSGGDALHTGVAEAIVYRDVLIRLGILEMDILSESDSMNTWQNAQFSRDILQRIGADQVVLVSSGIHLQRSMLYFKHFGVIATPVRADYARPVQAWLPKAYNFAVAEFALHEYLGIARYHVYNALGWNRKKQLPGSA